MAPRQNAENENENGGDNVCKYLVEASRKAGLFEPYDQQKHYLVRQDQLSKMLSQSPLWAVWSAKWVSLELTPLDQLESIYGEIEVMD